MKGTNRILQCMAKCGLMAMLLAAGDLTDFTWKGHIRTAPLQHYPFERAVMSKLRTSRLAVAQHSRDEALPAMSAERKRTAVKPPNHVRGIYISGWVAGGGAKMNRLLHLVSDTDLNAVVIDVKNDFGKLTYRSGLPATHRLGASAAPSIPNMKQLIDRLHRQGIYVIGRVVVFNDPLLAARKPEWSIHRKDGKVWKDTHGRPWIDPYRTEVWKYNSDIAAEAASIGIDEIQFDYVRFPEGIANKPVTYANHAGWSRSEAIQRFLNHAARRVHQNGAKVSADVFGLVTSSQDDMGIGQSWRAISREVDYISPMVYPSHYSNGMYGVANPDVQPYAIVSHAMADAKRRNRIMAASGMHTARLRPWLQSFTATWVHPHLTYGQQQIEEQIRALHDQGVYDFMLWSASCRYDYR
ncbi:putative glycoside hydrolase [Paenibacillus kobensis]|uniref:putative glycoside hydrolase n=1 Tax=Paenibacillus kobensis TaxID=59841 RepID=UPI001FECB4CE|nr:putative glycoside hydrolase [Paenibacillus kobensis]